MEYRDPDPISLNLYGKNIKGIEATIKGMILNR
jgi:hypothetical protein